ncbi:MAG: HAD family hydrolase [Burkholderiaceae bacterium]
MRRPLPTPRAVLFDLDGTLADTAPDLAYAVNRMREDRGLPTTPYDLLRPMASAGARGLIGVAFGVQPGDIEFEAMRTEFLANYEAHIADSTVLFDDIVALLTKIESNDQRWGVVTNKPLRYTDALLPLIGLAHAACSISGDTTPHAKPHPEPLFEAARRLQLAPEQCWYVGDDLRDIQAGKAAGMPTIAAGWGYCGMSEPANWDADFIAGSPREIIELLSTT